MIAVARRDESQLSSQIPQGRSWQSFHRRLASRPNAFLDNNEQTDRCAESNVDSLLPNGLDDLGAQSVGAFAASRCDLARRNVDGPIDVDRGVAIVALAAPIACTACRGRIR